MKLNHLHVENVLGIQAADVALRSPVALFAAANGNGKTSLAEAVRMVLTTELHARELTLKKEYPALVHNGAKSGSAEITLGDGRALFALLPSGKTTPVTEYVPHPALPFVLDAPRFAALEPKARRAMLFNLMGLKTDGKAVIARLLAKGLESAKIDRISPQLRSGFDAACTDAKAKATEAKGAWRAVTGETYGSVKAEDWKAPIPAHDEAAGKTLATELQHCNVVLEGWQQTIGKLQVEEQRRTALRAKLPALTEQAGKLQRIQDKLTADESGLAEWAQRLADTTAKAGSGPRVGLIHDLATAVAYWLNIAESNGDLNEDDEPAKAALAAYEQQYGKIGAAGDPDARNQLASLTKSRDLMSSAVANGRRDLDAAKVAKAEADSITAELAEEFDAAGLANARTEADKLKATHAELVKKLDVIKAQKVAAEAAEKKTKEAKTHHADVVAWDKIAAALAPDGIPGEMLSEALAPFNDRLTRSAIDAEWPRIEIRDDMTIIASLHERPYSMLSESEKWRADTMLAEAISHLSGLKLMLLDRFDVLDAQGRTDALIWLDILASEGELETALVFGTMKTMPANLPPTIAAHWIERGIVGQLKAAA